MLWSVSYFLRSSDCVTTAQLGFVTIPRGGLYRLESSEQCWDTKDVDNSANVVGQGTKIRLCSNLLKTSQQKVSLMPTVFNRAEWMLTEALSFFDLVRVFNEALS